MLGLPSWASRHSSTGGSTSLALLCLLILDVRSSSAFSLLPEKRFRYQGLIDAGSLGLSSPDSASSSSSGVIAWGDWDGDQFLDAFVLSSDRKSVGLKLWDHDLYSFAEEPLWNVRPTSGDGIVNVIPSDYNRDGRLDLLIMTQGSRGGPLRMEVWLGTGREVGGISPKPLAVPSSLSSQPLLADVTGNMHMDLIGHPSSGGSLQMWENSFQATNESQLFNVTSAPMFAGSNGGSEQPCQLTDPHSSAFIDLDGDCIADLFLVCAPEAGQSRNRYQIWTGSPSPATANDTASSSTAGFTLSKSGNLPTGAGPLTFADMNRDGTIDVVFASCDSNDCYINIVYNKQVGLCEKKASATGGGTSSSGSGWTSSNLFKSWKDWWYGSGGSNGTDTGKGDSSRCRKTEELCVADDKFDFDFEGSTKESSLRVPFSTFLPGHRPLVEDKLTSSTSSQPISLAIGDFNKDGYPDILLLSIPPGAASDGTKETSVHILQNERCGSLSDAKTKRLCTESSSEGDDGRWLIVVKDGAEVLDSIHDARSASWVDVDEDGSLDLLLQRTDASSRSQDSRSITFIQNNYFFDAFFLKALTLNGACFSTCEGSLSNSSSDVVKYKPWGASLPGSSYKFTVLDPNGNRRAQQVGQSPQSSYRSLLTPYSYFGLGRTNNYVEKLFVGSTLKRGEVVQGNEEGEGKGPQVVEQRAESKIGMKRDYFLSMEGVIPNSQVVISPFYETEPSRPKQEQDSTSISWHRELYLHPGDWIAWVLVTLVTLILLLAGFVALMEVKERRQDDRERKKGVGSLNFDAL